MTYAYARVICVLALVAAAGCRDEAGQADESGGDADGDAGSTGETDGTTGERGECDEWTAEMIAEDAAPGELAATLCSVYETCGCDRGFDDEAMCRASLEAEFTMAQQDAQSWGMTYDELCVGHEIKYRLDAGCDELGDDGSCYVAACAAYHGSKAEGEQCASAPGYRFTWATECGPGLMCIQNVCAPVETGLIGEGTIGCQDDYLGCTTDLVCYQDECITPLADGQACVSHYQCVPEASYCDDMSGVCEALREIDAPCVPFVSFCIDGACCDGEVCKPIPVAGEPCTPDFDCDDSAYCEQPEYICRARSEPGEPCNGSQLCVFTAYCDADDVCQAHKDVGEACTSHSECLRTLRCEGTEGSETCTEQPSDAIICMMSDPQCTSDADCGEGYFCTDGFCSGCGVWMVGDQGEMRGLTDEGDVRAYPFEAGEDLMAIACKGEKQAWVVGSGGTLLRTIDVGMTWIPVELDLDADLRDVVASEAALLYAVGDDGVVLQSTDEGVQWSELAAPSVDWTGVATNATGTRVLLTGRDGSIWRSEDQAFEHVYTAAPEALFGVFLTPDGERAAAVGQAGALVTSADGGTTWTRVELTTTADLHAVQVGSHDDLLFAVGAGGALVRTGESGLTIQELLDPALSLYGIHLNHDGVGHVVGDYGIVLRTDDFGFAWSPLEVDTPHAIRGIDAVGDSHL